MRTDIYWHVYLDGSITTKQDTDLTAKAINQDADPVAVPASGAAGNTICFGNTDNPTVIWDTGWWEVYKGGWGLWPIAEASWGLWTRFKADWVYDGCITFDPPTTCVTNTPTVYAQMEAYFDFSCLFDLVEAKLKAYPQVSMSLPVVLENGDVIDSDKCFGYRLDIWYWVKVGSCWFFGVCDKAEDRWKVFAGHTGGQLCHDPGPPFGAATAAAEPEPPPDAVPAVATDGFGHTQAIWLAQDGRLTASAFDGRSWSSVGKLAPGVAQTRPRLVYYGAGPRAGGLDRKQPHAPSLRLRDDLGRGESAAHGLRALEWRSLVRDRRPDTAEHRRGGHLAGRLPQHDPRVSGRRRCDGRLGA